MNGWLKKWQVWNKIYRADLFKKVFYDMEDEYSVLADDIRIFYFFGYYAKSVSLISDALYKWRWGFGLWSGIESKITLERFKVIRHEGEINYE